MDITYIFNVAFRTGATTSIQPYTNEKFAITMTKDDCSASTIIDLGGVPKDGNYRSNAIVYSIDGLMMELQGMLSRKEK